MDESPIAAHVNGTHTIVEDTIAPAEALKLSIDLTTAEALQIRPKNPSLNTALPPLPFNSTEISISTRLGNIANDLRNIGLEQSKYFEDEKPFVESSKFTSFKV